MGRERGIDLMNNRVSVNRLAAAVVERMMAEAASLNVDGLTLPGGARVIDCGIGVQGSLLAGKYLAEICMGGLGQVSFLPLQFRAPDSDGDFWLPGLGVTVDHPAVACMASQYAGWAIKRFKFFAMGSGPARALAAIEKLYDQLDYRDSVDVAILVMEGRQQPTDEVAGYVADQCGVQPAALTLLIAPTASVVGSVQIAARVVETGLHKLVELGFDVSQVLSGYGTAPLAPIAADDLHAIGCTNDAILYGGRVYYTVRSDDHILEKLIDQVPASASRDYGQPFYDLFKRYGDFYKVDPMLFSPAEVILHNINSGRSFRAGRLNAQVLRASLLGAGKEVTRT